MEPKGYVTTTYRVTTDSAGRVTGQTATRKLHVSHTKMLGLKSYFHTLLKPRKSVEIQETSHPPTTSLLALARFASQQASPSPRRSCSLSESLAGMPLPSPSSKVSPAKQPNSSTRKIEKMIGDCSEVQQSLLPIWRTACHHATGSLQLLETSRQALSSSSALQLSWKTSPRYLTTRNALDKRLKTVGSQQEKGPRSETPTTNLLTENVSVKSAGSPGQQGRLRARHVKSPSEPVRWTTNEEYELLEEIREIQKKKVDFGDLFKPVTAPTVKKARYGELDADALKSMSELNRFIFKERSKFNTRSLNSVNQRNKMLMEALMSNIEPSPEVLEKAKRLMQKEEKRKLKATRVDNYKQTAFSSMLKTWLMNPINEEQKEIIAEIEKDKQDVHKRQVIEKLYHRDRAKKHLAIKL